MVGIWGNSPSGLPIDSAHTYSERDRNLEYTKISPTQITNVYTAFLPYYMDHGGMRGADRADVPGGLSQHLCLPLRHPRQLLGGLHPGRFRLCHGHDHLLRRVLRPGHVLDQGGRGLDPGLFHSQHHPASVPARRAQTQIQTSMSRSPNRARSRLHRRSDGAQRPGAGAPIHRPPQRSWALKCASTPCPGETFCPGPSPSARCGWRRQRRLAPQLSPAPGRPT